MLIAVIGVLGFIAAPNFSAGQGAGKPIHVRWLQSHQPADVYARATRVFAEELDKESGGRLILEVITPSKRTTYPEVEASLAEGEVEIASAYGVALGAKDSDFLSLGMPFLFSDYAAVAETFDGPVAARLLSGLSSKTSVHALALTLSGGFSIVASNSRSIQSLDDIKGMRIGTSGGPVAIATLAALGAVPVPLSLEGEGGALPPLDAVESTYARLSSVIGTDNTYTEYLNETKHGLYFTAIVVSKSFYDSLSDVDRGALQKAALAAGRVEREDSVALNESTKSEYEKRGSVVTVLSTESKESFVNATRLVYEKFGPTFSSGILDQLISR